MSGREKSPVKTVDKDLPNRGTRKLDQKQDPAKPLPGLLYEAFVQEFDREADPLQAALRAGYLPDFPDRAWPLLLKGENVQACLNALRAGGEIPALRQKNVLEALVRHACVNFSDLYEKCPRTGAVRFNMSRATRGQRNALDFRHEITETNSEIPTRTLVTPPNRATALWTTASRMVVYGPNDEASEVSP